MLNDAIVCTTMDRTSGSGRPDEFVKKSPKMLPKTIFFSKLMHKRNRGKSSPNMSGTSVYLRKNLPEENNRPMGENSPNLVTLQVVNVVTNDSPN
jgi:hypothetical protein